jgi:NAD(P)-dependent dehydrogenase (short-subunit alcohol dehydrogenase family)
MRSPDNSGNDRIIPVSLDVTSLSPIADAARPCDDVDLVVNNAGVMSSAPVLFEDAVEALRAEMEVNAYGPMRMAYAFTPILAANGGGALMNMLSVVSWFTPPMVATYAASKHAALAVTESLRIELQTQATQVVSVHAGFIDTDMVAHITQPKVSPQVVARVTLDAIRDGDDIALADGRSKQVAAMTHLDCSVRQQQQAIWDTLHASEA